MQLKNLMILSMQSMVLKVDILYTSQEPNKEFYNESDEFLETITRTKTHTELA